MQLTSRFFDYAIGLTSRSLTERRVDYQHRFSTEGDALIVMLVDRLTRDEAMEVEKTLQEDIHNCAKRSALWKKFAPNHRENFKHWANDGGTLDTTKDKPIHGVYMVFWRPLPT